MKVNRRMRRRVLVYSFLILVLPPVAVSVPASARDERPVAQAADEPTETDTLPSAFKGVALSAGIVPFVKTPTEFDPMFPEGIARAEFPDIAFGTGYAIDPGLVARSTLATSQGLRVPTEVVCSVPGGREKEEFNTGEKSEMNGQLRVGGGAVKASCAEGPATVTSGYLYNLVLLTAPASQGAEPPGQTAMAAVGLASVFSQSVLRAEGLSVQTVAELKDINLGALGQVHFDAIKAESTAIATGSGPGTAEVKVTYAGLRVSGQERAANAEGIEAANQALAPLGLKIDAGPSSKSVAPDGTGAEAKSIGLVIEGAAGSGGASGPIWGERRVSVGLGLAHAVSHLSPTVAGTDILGVAPGEVGVSDLGATGLSVSVPESPQVGAIQLPEASAVGAQGEYRLALDWSTFRFKALPPRQAAATWGGLGLLGAALALVRRRFFPAL